MNAKQRYAIFIATLLIVLMVLFHAPWSGYKTSGLIERNATASEIQAAKGTGWTPIRFEEPYDLSYTEWRTFEPIGKWFGSPWNVVGGSFAVICIASVWCFLFRTTSTSKE